MKKIFFVTICMMTTVMASFAQNSAERSQVLRGEELKACLANPASKAQYIEALNAKAAEDEECRKYGVRLADVYLEPHEATSYAQGDSTSNGPHKASILDAGGVVSYHYTYKILYNTVDANNNNIIASAVIYTDDSMDDITFGLLSCHPTVASLQESPSGPSATDGAISAMGDENCMVVCPDYCGYGISSHLTHPYLIQDVTARNCIDAYVAAIYYLKNTVKLTFEDSFFSLFLGYSQGGSVAMACQKYYETCTSANIKKTINLRHTYCGDGPYSPLVTMQTYLDWANKGEKVAYPSALPLMLIATFDAYEKDCMHTVKMEDYFTPELLATGCIEALKSKKYTMAEVNDMIWVKGIYTFDQMLSDKMIKTTYVDGKKILQFNTESNEYKCFIRAVGKNDLTKGWKPTIKMTVFHFTNDKVVPQSNSDYVKSVVNNGGWNSSVVEFKDAYTAYKNEFDNKAWDLMSRIMSKSGDVSQWDHVSVGTTFYIWFMFGNPKDHRSE